MTSLLLSNPIAPPVGGFTGLLEEHPILHAGPRAGWRGEGARGNTQLAGALLAAEQAEALQRWLR